MNQNHKCLNISVKDSDYRFGDGQLKLTGVTTQNWLSHFEFFVPQRVENGDTDDCWCFGGVKNLDAFMDALISENLLPDAVLNQLVDWGFMDAGIDGNQHFHSAERFIGVLSGVGQNGGNLNTAYDTIRKYGVVPFNLLPVTPTMTLADYFAPIPQNLLDLGEQFLGLMGGKNFLQYQWLNDGGATDIAKMVMALPAGPLLLGVAVNDGWNQVHPTIATGTPAHVVSCYSIPNPSVDISDNYIPWLKVLDPGYQISYVIQVIVQYIAPPPAPVPPPDVLTDPPNIPDTESWLIKVLKWLKLIEE